MAGNLAYFVIREIIYAFLKDRQSLDEKDIITCILSELKSNKVIESMDKTNLDFTVVYCIFDLLSSLGFLNVKHERGQKCLTWRGFSGFFEKNFGVLNQVPTEVPLPIKDPAVENVEQPIDPLNLIPNIYDPFIKAFFDRMHINQDNILTSAEYQQIASQCLYSGKEFDYILT